MRWRRFSAAAPLGDDDLFAELAARRAALADTLAAAALDARLAQVGEGLYLAVAYMTHCSDWQPLYLVNRTNQPIVYIGRRLYAFASAEDGITDYSTAASAFADGIAPVARLAPGERLAIDEYSMSFDGDFVGSHRVVILQDNEQVEMHASVGKLGGYLGRHETPGIHGLRRVKAKV